MLVSLYLEDLDYIIKEPQTLNFGGRYLYSFIRVDDALIVRRKPNEKYIPNFFNVSGSNCAVDLLSAVVGQNGVGKSSILDVIRNIFVDSFYRNNDANSTVLAEVAGETKLLVSYGKTYLLINDNNITDEELKRNIGISNIINPEKTIPKGCKEIDKINLEDYQTIYYSPHFDLKYSYINNVDKYDISLDKFIEQDLENVDKKGTNENGWKYDLHEELIFKNSIRQIEFLDSLIFKNNSVFREIFDLPQYETGILYFRDMPIPELNNTPYPLRPIINLILEKVENERSNWHIYRDSLAALDERTSQTLVNRYLLSSFIIRAFISTVINHMEKSNTWLDEAMIDDSYNRDRFKDFSARDLLFYFIKESYIKKDEYSQPIFNYREILPFFENIELLIARETNPENVKNQGIRLSLDEVKKILQLQKSIVRDLLHYYPKRDGLVDKNDYNEGFISYKPTDRNMSSGENALLNFFSKLYNFIQSNLVAESKSLASKQNYILLLDEADLGFHPIWKKKYINAILKALPNFFESLQVQPRLQIIITTHDPLTLSDLPSNNVVFLEKNNGYCNVVSENDKKKIQKTFGANITDLLAHSFFVDDGLIGDFSKSKIKEVIGWINKNKKETAEHQSSQKFIAELDYYKKVVNLIDEKVVKIKLAEMLTDLTPNKDYYNNIIEDEIELLRAKKI